jgi:hypothetical protein
MLEAERASRLEAALLRERRERLARARGFNGGSGFSGGSGGLANIGVAVSRQQQSWQS